MGVTHDRGFRPTQLAGWRYFQQHTWHQQSRFVACVLYWRYAHVLCQPAAVLPKGREGGRVLPPHLRCCCVECVNTSWLQLLQPVLSSCLVKLESCMCVCVARAMNGGATVHCLLQVGVVCPCKRGGCVCWVLLPCMMFDPACYFKPKNNSHCQTTIPLRV